jgi:hypothetical protein
MKFHEKMTCKRVRRNNGILEAFFTRHPSNALSQEEHVLVNVLSDRGEPQTERDYWITIEPAFPHSSKESSMEDPNKPRPPGDHPDKPAEPQPTK